MSTDTKPKGPASYFPFIEKTYGQPVAHWFGLLAGKKGLKYMELVSFLKSGTAWASQRAGGIPPGRKGVTSGRRRAGQDAFS